MNLCEIGDIAVIENSNHGIIECPVIYVNEYFIMVKSKYYNMTINIFRGKEFCKYINEMNRFVEIKRKEDYINV